MLRKFLLIGLGGSGGKTLRYLKQRLEEKFEEIGWEEGMPDGWQFLHIDTPAAQDSPVLPGSPALLDQDEYLPLAGRGIGFEAIVDILDGKGQDFSGWLVDPRYMNIPIAMGAGQYRAVGRIIGLYYTARIKRRLVGKQRALMQAGAGAQLNQLAGRLSGTQLSGEGPPPVVIVISSLAGGTGAGILIDVCDLLRADGDKWLDQSIGILYSADVFGELSSAAGAGIQPNTAAAVAELLHGYYGDGGFIPPGGGAVQQRSGPAFPYLVGHANTKGVGFGDQVEVYRFMAGCLSAVVMDRNIQDDFTVYMSANWKASAGKFPGRSNSWMLPSPRYQGAFQALGFAEVDLGVGRLRSYAEQRITRDAVEWLLNGHMKLAEEWPDYEKATVDEVVKGLADRAFTRFLKDCRLNERGLENNQILDAIEVPEEELRAVCISLANRVREEGRDSFGPKAKASVGEWVEVIDNRVRMRRREVLKRLEDRLKDACLQWVIDTPDRILKVLGKTLAEQGARVALELLARTNAEMEDVTRELHTERQEQLSLGEHLRSDISDAIGVTSGTLTAESDSIRSAIQVAIQTGVVRRYNADHRELGALLAEDFRTGLLEPLARALRNAVNGLRAAVEADRGEAGSTLIEDWPRHDPRSDQRVPDALKPGESVMSVIDPDEFPLLFDDLTAQSTGLDGKIEARRSVRKTVISGDADRPAIGRWIDIDSRWTARDWLTVDSPPNNASFTVRISRDHLLARACAWLDIDGSAWRVFLSQGLRGYLSDRLPPADLISRERRFRVALQGAFDAAEPLASIDPEVLAEVHPGSELNFRPYTSPIPVAGLPVEEKVRNFLVGRFKDTQDNYQQEVDRAINQSASETRVAVYASLGSALHPMVFESLNKPIAEAWENATINHFLQPFWNARRARPLWMAVPGTRPQLQAAVRGWFIGRLLNLIQIQGDSATFEADDGPFSVEAMLPVPGRQPVDFLATLLEAWSLALPVAVNNRQPDKYLRPYMQLIEWGSEPNSLYVDSFLYPSQVLSYWLEDGNTPGRWEPRIRASDRPARRKEAIELLQKQIVLYKQAEVDRSRDCSPKNSWLGIAEIIYQALGEIVSCLEGEETEGDML